MHAVLLCRAELYSQLPLLTILLLGYDVSQLLVELAEGKGTSLLDIISRVFQQKYMRCERLHSFLCHHLVTPYQSTGHKREDKIRELLDPKMTVRFFLLSELACKNDKLNKYAKKFRVTQTLTYMKKQRSQLPSIHVNKIEKACLQAYKITIIRSAI